MNKQKIFLCGQLRSIKRNHGDSPEVDCYQEIQLPKQGHNGLNIIVYNQCIYM